MDNIRNFIPPIPGELKDGDDTRTNVLKLLGIEDLEPLDIGDYNKGYYTPPVASLKIGGKEYSLAKVLGSVGEKLSIAADISFPDTWPRFQQAVRNGSIDKYFSVGDQFTTSKGEGSIVWDIVDIGSSKRNVSANGNAPADPAYFTKFPKAKPVTLLMHDVIYGIMLDNTEALYYCENGLADGIYNFTIPDGYDVDNGGGETYQFPISTPIPAGGVIMFPWASSTLALNTKISTYATRAATTALESNISVMVGDSGADLGTADGLSPNMNQISRVRYGSNNLSQSAIQQWLDSAGAAGAFWTPKTIFDRPPSWNATLAGFRNGLEAAFINAAGETVREVEMNTITDDGTATPNISFSAKFFLPSRMEIFGTAENAGHKGVQFQSYVGSGNADRIKYDITNPLTARYWWTRSPYVSYASYVRYVYTSGALYNNSANTGIGAAAACVIL